MTDACSHLVANAGSFRDPTGRIYEFEGRVFRVISREAIPEYEFLRDTSLLSSLSEKGWIIGSVERSAGDYVLPGNSDEKKILLEHPRIPFISYPYEWPFRALQQAALLHLDLQLELLRGGATLSDATAYNIQFDGARPMFIDVSSLRRYRENEIWVGHRQFCEQFLNPLLLLALTGVPYHSWYRGSLEGITARDLAAVLSWRCKADWRTLIHVVLQARFQSSASRRSTADLGRLKGRGLSRSAFQGLLRQIRNWIEALHPKGARASTWADYERTHTYEAAEHEKKLRFVSEFAAETVPGILWDLGCNAGQYSIEALRSGAQRVIGFDYDLGAVDAAFERSREQNLPFLPLFLDAANPTPSQGWSQSERLGLSDRGPADAVIALAFEHHLTIGRNVPIPEFLDWLVSLAPRGVVEFVEKDDPTVQTMLALREDIFGHYCLENFRAALAQRARIIKETVVSSSGRRLFWYER